MVMSSSWLEICSFFFGDDLVFLGVVLLLEILRLLAKWSCNATENQTFSLSAEDAFDDFGFLVEKLIVVKLKRTKNIGLENAFVRFTTAKPKFH